MKKLLLLALSLLYFCPLMFSEEGTCHKCEVIREENKKKVNPYKYYEDYLKAKEQKIQSKEVAEKEPELKK